MVDPAIEDAVNALDDRVQGLQQALERHGPTAPETRDAEEAVCLAVRFALALFLPAWVESGGEYDKDVTGRLRAHVDAAVEALSDGTPYSKSVSERREELEEYLAHRKTSLLG